MMKDIEQIYDDFANILSNDELESLAAEYGVVDKRIRLLPVRIFFWLMVLSACIPATRGGLMQLVAFFIASLCQLFPTKGAVSLTRMAISKKLKAHHWYFFRAVYNKLLERYVAMLDTGDRRFLSRFRDGFAIDSSVIRVNRILEKVFASVHKGQAAIKLHTKFSIHNLIATKVQVTQSKGHDSRFRGITNEPNILYLFDLAYFAFYRFEKIMEAGSFFVSRLKSCCDPLIVDVEHKQWKCLIGKKLSEVIPLLNPDTPLDVTVKLSSSKQSKFKRDLRLVGIFHKGLWRFYITNIFDKLFTPCVIYQLYARRWVVEIFFNEIKHVLRLEHIISKNKNGIMVEIYSALIFYLLTRIVIALSSQQTGSSLTSYSFKRSAELVKAFITTHIAQFFVQTKTQLVSFLTHLVEAISAVGLKDTKHCHSP
jgi:IS4 transposase